MSCDKCENLNPGFNMWGYVCGICGNAEITNLDAIVFVEENLK